MTVVEYRRAPAARGLSLAIGLVAALGFAGWAGPARGQCTVASGPTDLHLNTAAPYPLSNFTSAVPYMNGTRAAIRADYGFGVYDITSPSTPTVVSWANHFSADPTWGFYGGCGDGQSFSTDLIAASGDGARVFSSTASKYECRASNLVMSPDGNGFFKISGDTGYSRAKFLAVQKSGSRYILYGFSGVYSNVWAADVSDPLPGFIVSPYGVSPSKGNVPFETTAFPAASSTRAMKYVDPGFLLLADYDKLSIVDVSNPGPRGSITTGKSWRTILLSDFGRPDYPASQLLTVGAALNSAGNLFVVGEFKNASNQPDGFSLLEWNPTTGSKTFLGSFSPPAGFSGPGSMSGSSVSLVEQQPGVGVYFWAASQTGGTGDKPRYRLYSATGDGWKQGTFPQEVLTVDTGANSNFAGVSQSEFAWRPSNNDVVSVIATAFSAYTLNLSCQTGPAPATSALKVEMEPCPATGPCEVKTGSLPVVVGQKLKISPTILPSAAVLPILDWRLDFDFHSPFETPGTGWGSLKNPDYRTSPTWTAGTTFSLIGPCDKNVSADPTSGANCWTSVTGNSSYGGPDFGSVNPAWGTISTGLQIAFEGFNSLGTSGSALVPVTWKIPTVQLASNLVLKGNPLQDATERPTNDPIGNKAGYKWYIPNAPNTNPVPGDLVTACNGLSTCTFNPTGGPGVYKVWLTTPPYPGGYQSCDVGGTCGSPLLVTLAEIVPSFTIGGSPAYPTTVLTTQGSLSVVDATTQKGVGINITGYKYCTAAVGSSCDPATGTPFTPGATAITPLPAKGDYWFFFGVNYTGGASSFEYFTPNKETNPRAWLVHVTDTPPSIVAVSGVTVYPGFGQAVTKNQSATVALSPAQAANWSASGGGVTPATMTNATQFTFTATSAPGPVVISVNTAGVLPLQFAVIDPNPPPSGVNVSIYANPPSAAPGTPITFTANPSGGSGSYSSYSWNFGDGTTAYPYNSPSHPYANAGTYTVTCTVTDSNGATGTGSMTMNVSPGGGATTPDAIQPLQGATRCTVSCTTLWLGTVGTPIQVAAYQGSTQLTTGTYNWQITIGSATPSSLSATNFTFTPTAPGLLRVAIAGYTAYLDIQVSGSVTPDFRISYPGGADAPVGADGSFLVPGGQQVTFRAVNKDNPGQNLSIANPFWNFGDGTTTGVNPAPKTYPFIPPYGSSYSVEFTVPGQPKVTRQVNVVAGIPTAAYSYVYSANGQPGGAVDTSRVTPGAGILFTSTGPSGAEYYWNFGDGTPCTAATPLSDQCRLATAAHEFSTPGSYTVVLTVKLGGNTFQTQAPQTFHVDYPPQWIVPGLSYKSGSGSGLQVISDVVIQNPCVYEPCSPDWIGWAIYSVALLDGTNPPKWITLDAFRPGESRRISNVLKTVFGKTSAEGTYAMAIRGDDFPHGGDPAIRAFTYESIQGSPAKGTYGDAISAVPASKAVGITTDWVDREYPGLRDLPAGNSLKAPAASTNIGFANTSGVAASVRVSFLDRSLAGPIALGGSFPVAVPPYQTVELKEALRNALAGTGVPYETFEAPNYWMLVEVVNDGARVVPWAKITDVASTDTTLLTALPNASGPVRIRVPGVVRRIAGASDGLRTRVVIFNTSGRSRLVKASLSYVKCPAGGTCEPRVVQSITPTVASGYTIVADDLVKFWFDSLDVQIGEADEYRDGYLDLEPADPNVDPLIVWGETYNVVAGGSFGSDVPGRVASLHGASSGGAKTRLTIPYVVPVSGGSGFGTTLGFVALGDAPAQATVRLRQPNPDSGYPSVPDKSVAINDVVLSVPLETLFPELTGFPKDASGYYSLEITATSGSLDAYAVIYDGTSGDGKLVLAQPLGPPR